VALEPVIDRSAQVMRQEAQGCTLVMLCLHTAQKLLALGIMAQAQGGSFGKGPLEGRMAAFFASGAHAFTTRCLAAVDQAAIGGEVLPAGETVDLLNCVAPHAAEDVPNAGDGVEQRERMRIVVLGRFPEIEFQVLEPCIVIADERSIDCDGFLHRRIMKALRHPVAIGLVGDVLADLGQVVWAMGIVPVRSQLSAFAPQIRTTPPEVTRGAQRSRIDGCLWQHSPAQQGGHLVGIACVVFGLTAMEGLHGERMPQDEGHAFVSAESSEPIPGEDACNGHDQPLAIRGNGLEERFRSGLHVAVQQEFPLVAQDTDRHRAGMQVDTTVKLMRLG
jgi:hypothetical protein